MAQRDSPRETTGSDGGNTGPVETDGTRPDLSLNVIATVAETTDSSTTDLRPLYEAVDPDALNSLFGSPAEATGSVSFRYEGCLVTVQADGRTDAAPIDEAER